jgi:hypothetical protein
MDVLIASAGMLITLLAFSVGFFLGCGARDDVHFPTEPAQPDEQKRQKYEADQQALADCLNYSIDVAYGGGKT